MGAHSKEHAIITRQNESHIYNWSGVHPIAPKQAVHYPTTEREVQELIKRATKVRIVGNKLSFEQINGYYGSSNLEKEHISSDAIALDLKGFTGLVCIDATSATFGAATALDDVIRILAERNMMLKACLGVIGLPSLAGAISTGTHGQGLYQADYAHTVKRLKVVLPNGEIRIIDQRDPFLGAYTTSLGLLGVILETTMEIEPRRVFTCMKSVCDVGEFKLNFERWNREVEYAKAWWFPATDECQIWKVSQASYSERVAFEQTDQSHALEIETSSDDAMDATLDRYMNKLAQDTSADQTSDEPQFRTIQRFYKMNEMIGWSEQILTKGIPVPQINCEIAVPFSLFGDATSALHNWNAKHPGRLHYPFIYRVVGTSSAWLSASNRGPMCWIGFLVYISQDGVARKDGMETMKELQQLLATFHGLPHWGKCFSPKYYRFEREVKKWKDFKQIVEKNDPSRKLMSKFCEKLFHGGTIIAKL